MPDRKIFHAIAVVAAMGCGACAPSLSDSPSRGDALSAAAVPNGGECPGGEELIFAGEVEDDFGLGIAVCMTSQGEPTAQRITIRYSGEGGGRTVTCLLAQCDSIIEFSKYVRPRFTILTLLWRDENGEQKLVESYDAQNEGKEPVHIVQHYWAPASRESSIGDVPGYHVEISTPPLSLLALSEIGEPHS